jgi:hypothetical protein
MICTRSFSGIIVLLAGAVMPVRAQISKGQQILLNRGLQLQGVVITGDPQRMPPEAATGQSQSLEVRSVRRFP